MTRLSLAGVLSVLCVALVATPAALAKPRVDFFMYSVTDAALSEQLDFQGDGGRACAQAGVCGYTGHVSYAFPGVMDGEVDLIVFHQGRRSSAIGFGQLDSNGITDATVSGPGDATPCTERIIRRGDAFLMGGTARHLTLSFHPPEANPSYVDTYCVGPSDSDLWHAGALPPLSLPVGSLRRKHLVLGVSSRRSFHSGPFTGTLTLNASIRLRRERVPAALRELFSSSRRGRSH